MLATRSVRRGFVIVAGILVAMPLAAHAAMLTFVRDTISTSGPGFTATHTVEFTLAHAIPASGQIVITPQDGAFSIPIELTLADITLSVARGGPYIPRTLAATPSATEDGVSIIDGSSGSITFTLSDSGIPAGAQVRVVVGSESAQIRNPIDIASYRIFIRTDDASSLPLDNGTTMIAVVAQVGVTSLPTSLPPTRSAGLPAGVIEANNPSVELSLVTDKPATCRYATTTDVAFEVMPEQFSNPTTFVFTAVVTGVQNNSTYDYYVRCRDLGGNTNEDDYVISFSVKPTPTTNTSLAGSGSGGSGGVGDYPGGSSMLFLSSVTLVGWTSPQSSVRILKDGTLVTTTQSKADGSFRTQLTGLERGLYTFALSAKDPAQQQSSSLSTTLTLNAGTNNTISDLVIPPTIVLGKSTIGLGESALLSGYGVPGATVEVMLRPTGGSARTYVASTTATGIEDAGHWVLTLPSSALSKGTYSLRARVVVTPQRTSDFGGIIRLGVGETVSSPKSGAGSSVSDVSGDDEVNLVDFSILLTNWGKAGVGDLNDDGIVNLADFSIMLFNWTG